jgi:hypothetical protein
MTNKPKRKMSRRDFLKLVGATGVAVPTTLVGANLLYDSRGVLPEEHDFLMNTRPADYESSGNQPILIVINDLGNNPFGAYLGEILLAEGINSFHLVKLSNLEFGRLSRYDIVILSDGFINQDQADRLSKYVFDGGNLIAMHPDAKLLPILGLREPMQIVDHDYMVVDRAHELASGISTVSMQYHGEADGYSLAGAQTVAWLCNKNGETGDFPAVTINKYENGWACAWTYDLASSVILTRQGNPKWADQERDGFDDVRPSDMFHGWLDLDRIEIPQADEQQRLLINVIDYLSQDRYPLPRLWYFPDRSKSILIATSDAHQNPAWAMESLISHAEKYGGHISIYSLPPFYNVPYRAAQKVRWWLEDMSIMDEAYFPSPSRILGWRERGHEFGIHPLVNEGFKEGWTENLKWFTGVGYGPLSPTTRVHRILWDGWAESARLQAEYGFRMNLDYYHVGNAFQKPDGEWVYGHFTGSGLPMKFVDESGKILNIYQQLTQLADDHLLNLHWGGSVKLPAEQAVDVSKMLFDRSIAGGYAAIGAIFHTDPFAAGEQWAMEEGKWMDGTLEHAVNKNIPIWSAETWLDFVEARHDAVVGDIAWGQDGTVLNFTIDIPDFRSGNLSMLLPLENARQRLSGLEINGQQTGLMTHVLGNTTYAWFNLLPGKNAVKAFYR